MTGDEKMVKRESWQGKGDRKDVRFRRGREKIRDERKGLAEIVKRKGKRGKRRIARGSKNERREAGKAKGK